MVLSKTSNQKMEESTFGGLSLPSWTWLDEMFRDAEWRRPFKIEECRDGDSMLIRAELPGVDPDKDVEIEVVDGDLVISAQKSESHENNRRHVHRSEFRYGSLTRSIVLPKGIDESKIEATYKDGVLEVRVPMPAEESSESVSRIAIKRG